MPVTKEFTLRLEDRPGTLGKMCRALADRGINILAFQATTAEESGEVRFVADNPNQAKKVLDSEHVTYTEMEVAQIRLRHQPGELARAALQLGKSNINIEYAYSGIDPNTHSPLLVFGVAEAGQAAKILDQAMASAA